MKKFRKILAFILALVMVLSLVACGTTEEPQEDPTQGQQPPASEQTPQVTQPPVEEPSKEIVFPLEEKLDVTAMMIMGNAAYSYNDNLAWKYLQERSNINFEITEFANSEATEKMNLLMSSGEYTDILFKANYIDLNQYGMDGILIPLEDLIREYAPNLTALLDERDGWNSITAADGHIYALPMFQNPVLYKSGGGNYWINQKWLDAVGMDMPTNQDELYEVFKAFKEKDPNGNGIADEVPFATHAGDQHQSLANLISYFGEGLWFGDYWMVVDGQMEYLPTTEYFKENVLGYFNKLYAEGLLNEDAFTLTWDQRKAVCGGEEVVYGMMYDSSPSGFTDDNEILNWSSLRPFDASNFGLDTGIQTGGFSITDKCKNPEILMAWVDFLYSEEGGRVLRNGIEDVSYVIHEDGTYEQIQEGFESNVYQATLMGAATVPGKIPELYYTGAANEVTRHINNEMWGENGSLASGVFCPPLNLTVEEQEEYAILFTDIDAYVHNYVAEVITGIVTIENTWDDFQNTLQQMQVERMIEIQQAAYARATAD